MSTTGGFAAVVGLARETPYARPPGIARGARVRRRDRGRRSRSCCWSRCAPHGLQGARSGAERGKGGNGNSGYPALPSPPFPASAPVFAFQSTGSARATRNGQGTGGDRSPPTPSRTSRADVHNAEVRSYGLLVITVHQRLGRLATETKPLPPTPRFRNPYPSRRPDYGGQARRETPRKNPSSQSRQGAFFWEGGGQDIRPRRFLCSIPHGKTPRKKSG